MIELLNQTEEREREILLTDWKERVSIDDRKRDLHKGKGFIYMSWRERKVERENWKKSPYERVLRDSLYKRIKGRDLMDELKKELKDKSL